MNPQITQMGADLGERDPQTYAIIGAAMAVHRELGAHRDIPVIARMFTDGLRMPPLGTPSSSSA